MFKTLTTGQSTCIRTTLGKYAASHLAFAAAHLLAPEWSSALSYVCKMSCSIAPQTLIVK